MTELELVSADCINISQTENGETAHNRALE
jgi:hypothetical protein